MLQKKKSVIQDGIGSEKKRVCYSENKSKEGEQGQESERHLLAVQGRCDVLDCLVISENVLAMLSLESETVVSSTLATFRSGLRDGCDDIVRNRLAQGRNKFTSWGDINNFIACESMIYCSIENLNSLATFLRNPCIPLVEDFDMV